jgi:RNA polymerase sigma-70 factor (ECF subfamily)
MQLWEPAAGRSRILNQTGRAASSVRRVGLMRAQRMASNLPSNREEERAAESQLVARCLDGDMDAFKRVYDAHATRLYNLAYRMAGTTGEAEELLQEIFLLAFRKLSSFRGNSSLGTWLYRLAVNLCLDHVRGKQGKMSRATVALHDERGEAVAAPRTRPVDSVVHKLDLEKAIDQLPASYRAAFLLHDVEGFEHHEVGKMLGIAEGTSKSLVHKARLRIRAFLSAPRPAGAPAYRA